MSERVLSIDRYRGLAIVLMVAANFLGGVNAVPAVLKHAPDIGLTVIDLIAPMFVFAIALTYRQSFDKHLRTDGAYKTYLRFATRYLAILGVGAILTAGQSDVAGMPADWGVLQAIGVAGLITLLVIRLNAWARAAIGLALLGCYQVMLDHFWLSAVLHASHGGFLGALSWSAMLVLGTAVVDIGFSSRRSRALLVPAVLVVAAVVSALWVPISKNRVSLSYVMVSVAACAVLYALFEVISQRSAKAGPLVWWGRNPLLLYVLHEVLLGFFALVPVLWWYADAPLWQAALQLLALLGVISLIARALFTRKIVISI